MSKKHNLVLKMAIFSSENDFLFIIFSNSHIVVGIGQVQLGKILGQT